MVFLLHLFVIESLDKIVIISEQVHTEIEAEVSPLTLIQKISPEKSGSQFFLSCGDKDQYGFYYGANTFAKLAETKGFQVIWRPVANGQHCSVDTDALAKFLQ